MTAARKRKPIEPNDGSYGGMVLAAFDTLSTSERDPRTDPRQGDTVTVGTETREVESVINGRVIYSWPGKVAVRSMFIEGWRAWCANASHWTASALPETAP